MASRRHRGKKSRRGSRKLRRMSRRSRRVSRRCMYGGAAVTLDPAPAGAMDPLGINQTSPSQLNLAAGRQYGFLHAGQHGGAATPLTGAPVGYTGVLDSSLRSSAGVDVSDRANAEILGLSDQSGGGRRRAKRRGSRRSRRRISRRRGGKKQRGGATLTPADYNSPGLLLPSDLQAKALGTMNPEWKLAADPTSFAPK
jgi:hypothetical protein